MRGSPVAAIHSTLCRLQIGDTAECNSALHSRTLGSKHTISLAPDTNVAGHRMFYARRQSADDEGVVGCARGGRAPKFSAGGAA
jgi:hypothetical protein